MFSSQEAINYIRDHVKKKKSTSKDVDVIARMIAYEAIYARHGKDNTTVMIIALNKDICNENAANWIN